MLQGESFNHNNLKDFWLESLRKLHLVITVDKDIYNLHLLIHDYFCEQLKQHLNFSQIKQAFCDVFADVASNIDQSTNLETFNLIEPHLKQMIAWCVSNENTEFARSLNGLALLYYSQGRYNDAEPLYLQSLDIRKRQLGDDHPTSLNNLALLYESQGKYLEAENLAKQALVIYQNRLGNQHPNTQNAASLVKSLYIMRLLHCNKETLFGILHALAQQANLPELNNETALTLLERIENNPELLSSIRESLQQQTDASDDNT